MSESTEDFLAHFGIKGMKWGRRNSESIARDGRKSQEELRELDAATRRTPAKVQKYSELSRDWRTRDSQIRDARAALPQERENLRAAKAQYRQERYQIGKVAAKRILNDKKGVYYDTINKSNQLTQREQVDKIIQDFTDGFVKRANERAAASASRPSAPRPPRNDGFYTRI